MIFAVIEGGTVRACNLVLSQNGGSDETGASCLTEDLGKITNIFSGENEPQVLKVIYELELPIFADLPPLPSEYMVKAPFGLIGSHVEVSLHNKGMQNYIYHCHS